MMGNGFGFGFGTPGLGMIVVWGLIIILVVWLGAVSGPIGAAWGLFAVAALTIPAWTWIWNRFRREWHTQ